MAPPSSHRVEDPLEEDSAPESHTQRSADREHPASSRHRDSAGHYYTPGHHAYGLPPHYSNPMMYYPPHHSHPDARCHYCGPNNYAHHGYTQESREQITPYTPQHREAQAHNNHQPQNNQHYQMQPHYVAVNVQNDVSQSQIQRQDQAASNKQLTLKEKVINHTTKALDSILDRKVLTAALVAFLTPRLMHHVQTVNEKKKRKGITLNLGFGGF